MFTKDNTFFNYLSKALNQVVMKKISGSSHITLQPLLHKARWCVFNWGISLRLMRSRQLSREIPFTGLACFSIQTKYIFPRDLYMKLDLA